MIEEYADDLREIIRKLRQHLHCWHLLVGQVTSACRRALSRARQWRNSFGFCIRSTTRQPGCAVGPESDVQIEALARLLLAATGDALYGLHVFQMKRIAWGIRSDIKT
ncbi:hypothetical protein [Bradyrhizobium barranii]